MKTLFVLLVGMAIRAVLTQAFRYGMKKWENRKK